MQFPEPSMEGPLSVETALANRRSVREFADEPLTPDSLGQILWATYGVNEEGPWNRRTVPSPAAMYPMELYVVAGDVEGLEPGVYRYDALGHSLEEVEEGEAHEQRYQRDAAQPSDGEQKRRLHHRRWRNFPPRGRGSW